MLLWVFVSLGMRLCHIKFILNKCVYFSSVNLSYVCLFSGPAENPKRIEVKFCLPYKWMRFWEGVHRLHRTTKGVHGKKIKEKKRKKKKEWDQKPLRTLSGSPVLSWGFKHHLTPMTPWFSSATQTSFLHCCNSSGHPAR